MTMKKEKVARFRVKKIKVLSIRKITREYQLFIISWKITTICLKVETRRSCKLSVARTSWKASICLSWFMELAPFFFSCSSIWTSCRGQSDLREDLGEKKNKEMLRYHLCQFQLTPRILHFRLRIFWALETELSSIS